MNNREFRRFILFASGGIFAFTLAGWLILGWGAGLLALITGSFLLLLMAYYTRCRYRELAHLNDYLSDVLSGVYDLQVESNAEGELSILRNNLYKATVRLRTQNEKLEADQLYLASALADISHQLKTPLTSMMMMNELLENETNAENRAQFISIQQRQLDKMNWLIQNLLKLSKLDAGTIQLKDEPMYLNELAEESLQPFLLQMDRRGIRRVGKMDRIYVRGDLRWTAEAVQNIVKNCLEHMDDGGSLEIAAQETTLYASLLIRDDGCGIPPEELPHIFERFYHGKDAPAESVGIGLALAKAIIEKERGKILVTSAPGEGTAFEIRFYKAII